LIILFAAFIPIYPILTDSNAFAAIIPFAASFRFHPDCRIHP